MAHRRAFTSLALVAVLLLALFPFHTVHAAAFAVNNTADIVDKNPGDGVCAAVGDVCTLRAAIMEANTTPGTTDTINVRPGTYTLTLAGRDENNSATGDLDILGPVIIIGANGNRDGDPTLTKIQAGTDASNGIDKVFSINPNSTTPTNATFQALTIRNGYNTSGDLTHGFGGGIDFEASGTGKLTIYNCIISENTAGNFGGGGLNASNHGAGPTVPLVTMTRTTFTNNTTLNGNGGAILLGANVSFSMTDSTVSNNTARIFSDNDFGRGGGLYYGGTTLASTISGSLFTGNYAGGRDVNTGSGGGGGIYANGLLQINNSTISGNTATGSGGGGMLMGVALSNVTVTNNRSGASGFVFSQGGGIDTSGSATTYLRNTIVAGNYNGAGNTPSDLSGAYNTADSYNNLAGSVGPGGLADGVNGNQVGITDPRLAPLANNGGATQTHALLPGSPALDAGNNTYVVGTIDQRGSAFVRITDAADTDLTKTVDIGAYEAQLMIEDLPNRTIAVNSPTNLFDFYFGDSSLGSPSFTATSSNTALLPNNPANMTVLSGSTGKRTLSVNPLANRSGSTTITITAAMASHTVTDTFVLDVVAYPDLTLTKTHSGNFYLGQTGASFTITASNQGMGATSGVVTVTETLPDGLTATDMTGTGWTCVLASLNCTRSDALPPGAIYPPITLTVDVSDTAPSSLINRASIAHDLDNNSSNNNASDTVSIIPVPDLVVSKTHSGTFEQGQLGAVYTLTVSNRGDQATSGSVSLTDSLPDGLTATAIKGVGWDCVLETLTCTRADALPQGALYPDITITVDVAVTAPATLTNTAQVSGGGELRTDNNIASDPAVVEPIADLTVTSSHSGDFRQGQQDAQYSLLVSNLGGGPTAGPVMLSDVLPSSFSATAMSGEGWTCVLATLTCTRSDMLDSGASYPAVTLLVDVPQTAVPLVTNSATVSGGGDLTAGNNQTSDPTSILQLADLVITKAHTSDFSPGQTGAVFTLSVSNTGMGSTGGPVTLADTLPAGFTATALSGPGWSCALGTLTCTRADALAPGGSYPLVILVVDVSLDAPTSLTNTASVSYADDVDPDNNSASDAVTITRVPDLVVSKTHTGSFRQGQSGAVYTITMSNTGEAATSGVIQLSDDLPAGMTATAISGTGWTCTLAPLACTRADALSAGASYPPVSLSVDIANTAPVELTNTVQVSGGSEVNTTNDSASDTAVIIQTADLTASLHHTGDFRQGQQSALYELLVTNSGAGPTVGQVTIQDVLPPVLNAVELSGSGWSCVLGTLTCTRDDLLAPGSSYPVINLRVNVASDAPAMLTNSAVVAGGGELDTGNNTASDPTTVIPAADLVVTKSHSGDFHQAQRGAEFTLTVTNSGPGTTAGVVTLSDLLPVGLEAVQLNGEGWTCELPTLTCMRGDALAAGDSYPPVTLTVDVSAQAAAGLTNQAQVTGGGELNTANNSASDPVTVIPLPDLQVSKSHTGDFSQGQAGAQYLIRVSNTGNTAASGTVSVTDALPAGLLATALSGSGWTCSLETLSCQRSDELAAGASYPDITLAVNIDANAPAILTNTVVVAGGEELNTANNSASDLTSIEQKADLTVNKSHAGAFRQGQSGVEYSLTVSNTGRGPTGGVVLLEELLPGGLAAVELAGEGWSCNLGSLTCTRSDVLAAGTSYPVVTLKVNVAADAPASLTNRARVSGGGEVLTGNDLAEDNTVVHTRPVITLQPQDQVVWLSQPASFSASASGDPAPVVQWQESTDAGVTWHDLSGQTSPTLIFTMTAGHDGNRYRAVFTNEVGSQVTDAAVCTLNYLPVFDLQPQSAKVRAGTQVTLTVKVSARPVADIYWQVSTDGGVQWTEIAGASGEEYTFQAGAEMNGYRFRAVAVNDGGTAYSDAAVLTVDEFRLFFPLLWGPGR